MLLMSVAFVFPSYKWWMTCMWQSVQERTVPFHLCLGYIDFLHHLNIMLSVWTQKIDPVMSVTCSDMEDHSEDRFSLWVAPTYCCMICCSTVLTSLSFMVIADVLTCEVVDKRRGADYLKKHNFSFVKVWVATWNTHHRASERRLTPLLMRLKLTLIHHEQVLLIRILKLTATNRINRA